MHRGHPTATVTGKTKLQAIPILSDVATSDQLVAESTPKYQENCREWLRQEMQSRASESSSVTSSSSSFTPEKLWDMVVSEAGYKRLTQLYRFSNPSDIYGVISVNEFAESYSKLHRDQQVTGESRSVPNSPGSDCISTCTCICTSLASSF